MQCQGCDSPALSWDVVCRNMSGAGDGRLCIHDVRVVFVLGCDECSATVRIVEASEIAETLPPDWIEGEGPAVHVDGGRHERAIKALREIRADMERDVKAYEGLPFNGRTVSVALGQIMAAVSALAGIVLSDLEKESHDD